MELVPGRTLSIHYFAWVREHVGTAREELAVPEHVTTVGALIDHLRARGERYERAFARPEIIRVAIDRIHSKLDASLTGAREIAFFPPVTGG